ncbi:hypothetical protein ACFX15_007103 [Malus domestica]
MLVVLLLLLVIKFRFMSGGLLDPAIANNPDFPATSPTCSIVSSFVLSGAMGQARPRLLPFQVSSSVPNLDCTLDCTKVRHPNALPCKTTQEPTATQPRWAQTESGSSRRRYKSPAQVAIPSSPACLPLPLPKFSSHLFNYANELYQLLQF